MSHHVRKAAPRSSAALRVDRGCCIQLFSMRALKRQLVGHSNFLCGEGRETGEKIDESSEEVAP